MSRSCCFCQNEMRKAVCFCSSPWKVRCLAAIPQILFVLQHLRFTPRLRTWWSCEQDIMRWHMMTRDYLHTEILLCVCPKKIPSCVRPVTCGLALLTLELHIYRVGVIRGMGRGLNFKVLTSVCNWSYCTSQTGTRAVLGRSDLISFDAWESLRGKKIRLVRLVILVSRSLSCELSEQQTKVLDEQHGLLKQTREEKGWKQLERITNYRTD